jgi:hypothetical protein
MRVRNLIACGTAVSSPLAVFDYYSGDYFTMSKTAKSTRRISLELSLLGVVVVLGASSFLHAPRLAADALKNPLATADQREFEQHALRLLRSSRVQDSKKSLERSFEADPWAATPEGKQTLGAAVNELVFSGVVGVLNADPSRPRVQWVWAPEHSWFGLKVPGAKEIMPNIDNVFRIIPVDNLSHYQITARPGPGKLPTQWTLQLIPSVGAAAVSAKIYSQLLDSDLVRQPDGSFTLTVGPEPANGNPNHVQTVGGAGQLLIRDTIEDWKTETPYYLDVHRVDGPPPPPARDDDALTEDIPKLVDNVGAEISKARQADFAGPANDVRPPQVREGGRWGLGAAGRFKLSDEEALVLTLDPIGAKYLSVQLANKWLGALDYIHHTASLNSSQAKVNPDGTFTFVIAPRDAGVQNWVDSIGLHEGVLFVRWQSLPQPLPPNTNAAVRSVKVVQLSDLNASVPAVPAISSQDRKQQIAERELAYGKRFQDH